MTPVLETRDLTLAFRSHSGLTEVLHGISLTIARGERVALVGESGSGKSVTARIVLGLLQGQPGVQIGGELRFNGADLNAMPRRDRRALRGTEMSMIFQDPTSSLNPVFTIGRQFAEVLGRRGRLSPAEADARAADLLAQVSIPNPARVMAAYPFQLSGGMNQRVVIAMALANDPALLIADEPGTALDVTVQAQTLRLMRDMVARNGTAVLFISHNLGVVREFADRVYVIYRGRIVEEGPTEAVFHRPGHAYTRALMAAQPQITGGGIPDIPDVSEAFLAPAVIHERAEP